MPDLKYATIILLLPLLLFIGSRAAAQSSFTLLEGRFSNTCSSCNQVFSEMPYEVLFGIRMDGNNITFSMNNIEWFHKIINSPDMGITVDIVSRSRYNCNTPLKSGSTHGFVLKPIYRNELIRKADTVGGLIIIPIGKIPAHLSNQVIEGNLVIVNGKSICQYHPAFDIERGPLELLPMGFYTDTLQQAEFTGNSDTAASIIYTTKKNITLPFRKATATLESAELSQLRDSITSGNYSVRHIEVRAYSSVEGPEETNRLLMQKRAKAVQEAINGISPGKLSATIIPAENWIEFNRDVIPKMPQWKTLSKTAIKRQLQNNELLAQLEPLLAAHRKAVITIWLDKNTRLSDMANDALIPAFNKSVKERSNTDSRRILKEIAVRVADNRLPDTYIDQLEIPAAIDYLDLLSDRAMYSYNIGLLFEDEILKEMYALRQLKPADPFLNYNICTLEILALKFHAVVPINKDQLLANIRQLAARGIHPSLVNRMLINYNIVLAELFMEQGKYEQKDVAVEYVSNAFSKLTPNDKERYSLARFFTEYGRMDLATAMIKPRVNQLDAAENIIFYFINLCFFDHESFDSEDFQNAVLNAANINRARFCQFFQPPDSGGSSFQLLEYDEIRKFNCDNCPQ